MKCNSCGKEIPSTAQVCPFCLTPIESKEEEEVEVLDNEINFGSDLTTISSQSDSLNFGDLANTSYSTKPSLVIEENNKKKKKTNILPIIITLIVLIIVGGVGYLLFNKFKKIDGSKYYVSFINDSLNFIDESIVSANLSGTYRLHYSLGEEKNDFTGILQLDGSKKIFTMSGEIRITDPATGLVTDNSDIGFLLHVNSNKVYLQAPTITDYTLLLPYDDITNVLSGNEHNAHVVIQGIKNATIEGLKSLDYEYTRNVTYNFDGNNHDVKKFTLKLDNQAKKKFISAFYNSLMNNEAFIKEYSNYNAIDLESASKDLENKMIRHENKYGNESESVTYINYYMDDSTSYGFEIDQTKDGGDKYYINLSDNYLRIKKVVNNSVEYDLNIYRNNTNDSLAYSIEGEINKEKLNVKFELTKNNKQITYDLYNIKNIRNTTTSELDNISNKLKTYTTHTDWLYKLPTIFNINCKRDLKCECERKSCTCTDGTYTTTCLKSQME